MPAASLLHLQPPDSMPCSAHMPFRPGKPAKPRKPALPPAVSDIFLGTSCATVDCSCGCQESLENLRRFLAPTCQNPVVLKGFARHVLDLPSPWTLDNLDKMCGHMPVDGVRVAKPGSSTFDYADEGKSSCFFDASAKGQLETMHFSDFVSRLRSSSRSPYYLWSVLMATQAGQSELVRSSLADLLWQDLDNFKWEEIKPVVELGELGAVKKMQLFCSGGGAVTSCHYDQSQNLFLQLEGVKRFVLFPPLVGAAAFAPFPILHPRDRCARTRLDARTVTEGPFASCSHFPCAPLAHGRGIEAILEPGDCLFLPQMWWHHVESIAEENVSLSIWFKGGVLDQRPVPARLVRPLPEALALELAREWEFYLATEIGRPAQRSFEGPQSPARQSHMTTQ